MKQVAIFTEAENKAWILRRCAEEIREHYPGTVINPVEFRPINYFINYALYRPVPKDAVAVAFFTHLERTGANRTRFFEVLKKAHYGVYMNRSCRDFSIGWRMKWDDGEWEQRSRVIRPGCNERLVPQWRLGSFKPRPLTFGICGRVYPSGRKGEHLVWEMFRAGYRIVAHGPTDWTERMPSEYRHSDSGEIIQTYGEEGQGGEDNFYANIDYLVIPSLNEGGPIPLIDALAARVPVIAPRRVGWCDEFPCIRYKAGDWESLKSVLDRLANPPTWKQWADAHAKMFSEIASRENIAWPTQAAS